MNDVDKFVKRRVLPEFQPVVGILRALMREMAPDATEELQYGLPAISIPADSVQTGCPWACRLSDRPAVIGSCWLLRRIFSMRQAGTGTIRFCNEMHFIVG